MSFPISDVVSISLTIASGGLQAPSLSVPMLIGYTTAWVADRVRTYNSTPDLIADGITAGTPIYRMAQALLAQNPSPDSFKVGRLASPPVHAETMTCLTDTVGDTITVTIVGNDGTSRSYSRACLGGGIGPEATAVTALINNDPTGFATAGSTEILATANVNDVEITGGAGAVTGQIFWYTGLRNIDILDITPDSAGGLAVDIAAIVAEDNDWYAGMLDCTSVAQQTILAAELDVAFKSSWVASQDAAVRDDTAGNLFEVVNAAGRERCVPVYSAHGMNEYPACAAAAKMITFNPGATTLAGQRLSGVTASGSNAWDLTPAQLTNIRSNRGNAYIWFGNAGQIDGQAGTCAATRYVDERLTLDYLEANIPVELANALQARVNSGSKIPYTDEAATVARGSILRVLETAERWGALILTDTDGTNYFTFSATPAAAQLTADKTARIFRGVVFGCLITGAAQRFVLAGTLSFV